MKTRVEWRRFQSIATLLMIAWLGMTLCGCDKEPTPPSTAGQPKLVFATGDSTAGLPGLYTMNLDGSDLRPIAVTGDTIYSAYLHRPLPIHKYAYLWHPQWSPDGSKIAVEYGSAQDAADLVVMDADGGYRHALPLLYGSAYEPQWSPDGDQILYRRGVFGATAGTGLIDATGENDHNVTIIRGPQFFEGDSLWGVSDAQWGPTRDILYWLVLVNRKPATGDPARVPEAEVFSKDIHTGKYLERITRNDIDESGFKLSPDGRYIAFYHDGGTIVLSLRDAGQIKIPINAPTRNWNWSNDSESLVFAKDDIPGLDSAFYIYKVDLDRPTELIKLTTFESEFADLFVPYN